MEAGNGDYWCRGLAENGSLCANATVADKTEFWLPAFPYRCIDYLSDRGTYSEGLYRVPGSELEIKHYMRRFDTGESGIPEQREMYNFG